MGRFPPMARLYPKQVAVGSAAAQFLGPICQGLMKNTRTDTFRANLAFLAHGLDAGDLRNVRPQVSFDPHLQRHGARWAANARPVQADLNETSLQDAIIAVRRFKDPAGLRVMVKPQKLIIPPELQFKETRLLKLEMRVGK